MAHAPLTGQPARYKKSPAQVLLRWALDQDLYVIPGATSPPRAAGPLAASEEGRMHSTFWGRLRGVSAAL